jgi:hypothetical protein
LFVVFIVRLFIVCLLSFFVVCSSFVYCLFLVCSSLFIICSSLLIVIHCLFIVCSSLLHSLFIVSHSLFVHCSFIFWLFLVCSLFVRLLFAVVCVPFVDCSFVHHSFIVCSSFVPRFCHCLLFVYCLFIICSFVVCLSFVHGSFVHSSFIHGLVVHCLFIVPFVLYLFFVFVVPSLIVHHFLFIVRSSFICSSLVCSLFVCSCIVHSWFGCSLFVHHSCVRLLFVVCSSFVRLSFVHRLFLCSSFVIHRSCFVFDWCYLFIIRSSATAVWRFVIVRRHTPFLKAVAILIHRRLWPCLRRSCGPDLRLHGSNTFLLLCCCAPLVPALTSPVGRRRMLGVLVRARRSPDQIDWFVQVCQTGPYSLAVRIVRQCSELRHCPGLCWSTTVHRCLEVHVPWGHWCYPPVPAALLSPGRKNDL